MPYGAHPTVGFLSKASHQQASEGGTHRVCILRPLFCGNPGLSLSHFLQWGLLSQWYTHSLFPHSSCFCLNQHLLSVKAQNDFDVSLLLPEAELARRATGNGLKLRAGGTQEGRGELLSMCVLGSSQGPNPPGPLSFLVLQKLRQMCFS